MEGPRFPDDLRDRLQSAGLLDAFVSLPTELQTDFIEFIEASHDELHRESRIEMVSNLIRRSLCVLLVSGFVDLTLEPASRLKDVLAA